LGLVVAVALVALGLTLALDWFGLASRGAARPRRLETWYTSREGLQWNGWALVSLGSIVMTAWIAVTIPSYASLSRGALELAVAVLAALIVYATIQFVRFKPSK